MRTVAFASSAPCWRAVAQGLNLHGTCLNRACVAFEKEVIAPIGLEPFNIIAQQASCPMWKCAIAARTCGFHNCEWRFKGVKAKAGVHVASAWETRPSQDAYNLFDDDDSNMALWRSLVLVVQARSSSQTCALCKGDADGERTPCGLVWIDSSATRRAIGATCPECHVSID
ncbi:hypothetical protein SPRG_01333 [Saprolegnia parasitica CBS 223.65]|uniref:Uncharacterized protein n=1 Tax=Saprolegnia parasitica (strain CBS 223.65) TaxID=695850 RepID=A0A067CTM7_SAPPC|nr:hypothetical protein SPRG_01333 [Saprolegnia parasitica CBS 223.65]KDO34059.1 hypothetical protein SPRG_01333 [Saprolegnia parasitica CBS 223.65]|eukprot:XP_012194943.1 hypothetical protein SPRG_01333 [Saprolegnia parasitica CBS 223.65]